MSYRPKYNNEGNYSDLPVDAQTVAGHAVESSGVDSNTDTLPTTAQVKAYVDPKITANTNRIAAAEDDIANLKSKTTNLGYGEDTGETSIGENVKITEDGDITLTNGNQIKIGNTTIEDTEIRTRDGGIVFPEYGSPVFTIWNNGGEEHHRLDFLYNGDIQVDHVSIIPHLYEHNIVLADSSNVSEAQKYVTFTILSSSNTEFDTYYKIADKLINDGITGINRAKKASGRCDIDSSKFVVDVDFSNQETEDGYIETSVVGIYAWDDDPVQLKIVYSQLDERGNNCIKATNAPTTYVQDTVVPLF